MPWKDSKYERISRMRLNATTGLIIVILGLMIVNYGYLHDLIWQGAEIIVMGLQSYLAVLVGTIVTLVGAIAIMRAGKP